jgi:hypothetical protein
LRRCAEREGSRDCDSLDAGRGPPLDYQRIAVASRHGAARVLYRQIRDGWVDRDRQRRTGLRPDLTSTVNEP